MKDESPLILTLKIDQKSFEYFNLLRKKYFPPKINYLDAHLTLFHHLPNISDITDHLEKISTNQHSFKLNALGMMKLGGGVAYKLDSDELVNLHNNLQKQWSEYLISQDKQKLRPHITIQNKVKPEEALILYNEFISTFQPFEIDAIGFSLWKYLGGPWSKIKDYHFISNL